MRLLELVLLLVVAGVCGSVARALAGGTRGGCLVSIVLGFIGALLGSWLARQAGLPEPLALNINGREFPILWSIIGAALFVALLSLLTGRRRLRP
jgi:uncharacterized membrane protein YeaQ/YmgE (transglycosylase-associated protein family)